MNVFIQEWDISDYCINVPVEARPVHESPIMLSAWKGHFSSVVSLDLAEDRNLIISASTDRCVSLWASGGRYIGTIVYQVHIRKDYTKVVHICI